MTFAEYQTSYTLCPIVLTNGLAEGQPGGMISIVQLLEGDSPPDDPNDYFAHFMPLPGALLIGNEVGDYPFANQTIAANATIAMPLTVSQMMYTPAKNPGGLAGKLGVITALKEALDNHTQLGGTYVVATPAYIYVNCLLTSLRVVDGAGAPTSQVQHAWQWDFVRPLLSQETGDVQYGPLTGKMTAQLPLIGQPFWSNPAAIAGAVASGMGGQLLSGLRHTAASAVSGVATTIGGAFPGAGVAAGIFRRTTGL